MNTEDDHPAAIIGTSSGVKTMADNTLRITFDIEPRYAQQAFALFGVRGSPAAIAKIVPEAAIRDDRQAVADGLKGGELAKLAGQFCDSEPFRQWLRLTYDPKPRNSAEAAQIIRGVCGVDSRAHLDHVEVAAQIFHEKFRLPYNAWLKGGMK